MNFKIIIIAFLWTFSFQVKAQSKDNKWAVSSGAAIAVYSKKNALIVDGGYIPQLPRFSIARHMFKNIIVEGSISTSFQDSQKYTTFDYLGKYVFATSYKIISPYLLFGGSWISAKEFLPTVNIGAGGTLWISEKFGLNGQFEYRLNETRFVNQSSHLFISTSLVYRFSLSGRVSRRGCF